MVLTNVDMNQKTKAVFLLPTSPQIRDKPAPVMKSSTSITPTLSSVLSTLQTDVSSQKMKLQMKNSPVCSQCKQTRQENE